MYHLFLIIINYFKQYPAFQIASCYLPETASTAKHTNPSEARAVHLDPCPILFSAPH